MKVVFDIDGVLADVRQYVAEYLTGTPNWDSYFRHTLEFPVIYPVAQILWDMMDGGSDHTAYFITGRPESNKELTEQWLRSAILSKIPRCNSLLLMRPNGNRNSRNCDVKMVHIRRIKPDLIFDDDPELVEVALNEGFLVVQVHGFRITDKDHIPA